jgi:outer membrane autotransporter protein
MPLLSGWSRRQPWGAASNQRTSAASVINAGGLASRRLIWCCWAAAVIFSGGEARAQVTSGPINVGAINGTAGPPGTIVTVPLPPGTVFAPGFPPGTFPSSAFGCDTCTLSADGTTVTSTSRIEPVLISDANISGGIPNATITVVNPVGGPGLVVQNTNCCFSLSGFFDQPVVAAQSGGTVNLGNGTTAIGLGSATIANSVNYVLSALAENGINTGTTPALITGENVTVIAKDGAGTPPIVAIVSDGFGSTPTTIPMIRLSGLTLTASTASTATGLLSLDGGQITIMPPPQGGMSQLNITGSQGATGMALVATAPGMQGGTISLNNAIMTVTGDPANTEGVFVDGPVGTTATVNLNNSTVISNGLGILTEGGGTLNFTANLSNLTGAAITADNSISNVTFENGSIWTMTGSSNITSLVNDASTINFTPPVGDPTQLASYKTLTVNTYEGRNGTLGLNTFLGSDGSPSDRLVIRDGVLPGSATGFTSLLVSNTTGPGDLTVANGILVVDAQSTTAPGAFALGKPVVAGPFEYTLFRGSVDASAPESWFLRSTLVEPGPSPCPLPTPEGPTPPGVTPPGVTPPVTPPGQAPNFRPEVSLNAALPNLALIYGRSIVGTMHDRVGDEVSLAAPAPVVTSTAIGDGSGARPRATPFAADAPAPAANGAWGRVIAVGGDRDGGCPVLVGPSFDYWLNAVQAGFDAIRLQHPSGARDRAGVYGVFGMAHADVQSQTGTEAGRDRFAAYSVGAYWTHYSAWGGYLDGLVQGTFYDVRDESTRFAALETDGWGFAASLEAGVPFKGFLGGWSIEPQAQLVYQTIDLDESGDIGARVRFEDVDSLAGRVGVRFATSGLMPALWGLHPPLATTAWFRPSYWHEFDDDARTLFSSAIGFLPFRSNIAEDWVELNTGFTVQVDRHTALFATGSYDIATDNDGEAWQGRIGLKVAW